MDMKSVSGGVQRAVSKWQQAVSNEQSDPAGWCAKNQDYEWANTGE
jgi:hypothetical protein